VKTLALILALALTACSSVAEPEPEPATLPPEWAHADSAMAATDRQILFQTAPGHGENSPECRSAIRAYSLAVSAYAIALAAVRMAPSTANVAMATLAALYVLHESANVYNNCSSTRPA
jgi:hypothetical protein